MSKYWSQLRCLKGVGHFERKFQGEGVVHQRILASVESLVYHVVLFLWSYV